MNKLTYEYIDTDLVKNIYCKIQQLKDIEEDITKELGVDLITLSKVLKQKFVFNKEKVKVDLLSLFLDAETNKLYIYSYIKNTFEDVRLYAKDYGKRGR